MARLLLSVEKQSLDKAHQRSQEHQKFMAQLLAVMKSKARAQPLAGIMHRLTFQLRYLTHGAQQEPGAQQPMQHGQTALPAQTKQPPLQRR